MKKIVLIFSALVSLLLLVSCGCGDGDEHVHKYGNDYVCEICKDMAKQSTGLDYSFDGATNSYTVIGKGICTDKEIIIPLEHNGLPVKKIQKYAFYDSDIESLVISSNIVEIEEYALSNCQSLYEINVSNANEKYKSIDGNLYTKNGEKLIQYSLGKKDTEFVLPATVKEIGSCAFSQAPHLKALTQSSVKTIGASAFNSCLQLESITLDGVEAIKEYAFYNCENLAKVKIFESTTRVGVWAFFGCESLSISCEAEYQPADWHDNWNEGNCPVSWGNKEQAKAYSFSYAMWTKRLALFWQICSLTLVYQ